MKFIAFTLLMTLSWLSQAAITVDSLTATSLSSNAIAQALASWNKPLKDDVKVLMVDTNVSAITEADDATLRKMKSYDSIVLLGQPKSNFKALKHLLGYGVMHSAVAIHNPGTPKKAHLSTFSYKASTDSAKVANGIIHNIVKNQ